MKQPYIILILISIFSYSILPIQSSTTVHLGAYGLTPNSYYSSAGAWVANAVRGNFITIPDYGSKKIDDFSLSYYINVAGEGNFKIGIWEGTDGGALLAISPSFTEGAVSGWTTISFPSLTLEQGHTYLLGIMCDQVGTGYVTARSTQNALMKTDTANSFATPEKMDWSSSQTSGILGIYLTYQVYNTPSSEMTDSANTLITILPIIAIFIGLSVLGTSTLRTKEILSIIILIAIMVVIATIMVAW